LENSGSYLKGGAGGTTIFQRYIPIPAVALSSNSKLQQNQDTNNLKK
jgi:hypothetical protein